MTNSPSPGLPATQRDRAVVTDAEALFDTAQFEHMGRIAKMMAHASMIPDHLRVMRREDGSILPKNSNDRAFLDVEGTMANCFLIVNQARLFGGIDPFALAQSSYFVHGRLGYEGKLVQAVLERKIGAMEFTYFGEKGTPGYGIKVRAKVPGTDRFEEISGTVLEWQTQKNGSINQQWQGPAGQHRMLHYRGTREWARLYAPGLVLGLLDDDDLEAMREDYRSSRARPVEQSTSTAAMIAANPRAFNPLRDEGEQEEAQEPATVAEAPMVQTDAPSQPAAAASDAAPQVEDGTSGGTAKRVPRGTPARVDRIIMKIADAKSVEAVDEIWEQDVAPLRVEMNGLGVNFTPYLDKLTDARDDRMGEFVRKSQAAAVGADQETGELPDLAKVVEEFREAASIAQTFDALDGLVEEMLDGHALPKDLDAQVDEIIEAERTRIAAAIQRENTAHGEQEPAPAAERNAEQGFPGDVEAPPAEEQTPEAAPMTDEQIQETVDGWSAGMRKCKSVEELDAYNRDVVSPFMQGPYGPRVNPEQVEDARTTFKNRKNLLTKMAKDNAQS